ncbi:MAG: endopeptidase La [Bacteroidales bacterium]|jgi:ATP-dependent Lon protease|nr:endopeptidase La [Bacteroidales bacterium]
MNTVKNKSLSLMVDCFNNDSALIPLFAAEQEDMLNKENIPETLPVLPLRNRVLFPGLLIPISVTRPKSIKLVQEHARENSLIGVITQKANEVDEPGTGDLCRVGTIARILKYISVPDGSVTVIALGVRRFQIEEWTQTDPYFMARISPYDTNEFDNKITDNEDFKAIIDSIRDITVKIIKLSPHLPNEAEFAFRNIQTPYFLVNYVASNLSVEIPEKQSILEEIDFMKRAKKVLSLLQQDLQRVELKNRIQSRSKKEIDKQQREYFLTEQMKAIQEELGGSPAEQAAKKLEEKAKKKKWSKEVQKTFNQELQKLKRTNSMSPDYSVQLNYLELMVELPWNEYSKDKFDLRVARKVLDEDHFGLEKVKTRIIEYLAILKMKGDVKGPILCLAGPPGVGKTSLGKSIAKALGRKYVRVSLGGLRDESEIRGHRRTYIGAMPGRIITNIRKAGYANPVFVLDEIDKVLGMNVQGDPSAALLEVLDPEQNTEFHDNYLEINYDLSHVLFIATANDLSTIHPALRDRMEVIDIPGYILEEKVNIAQKHLIPKQLKEHGLKEGDLIFSDEVLEHIVHEYTRESGVRALEKIIAKIIRHRVAKYVQENQMEQAISLADLQPILGAPVFQKERSVDHQVPGVATGLAWTPVGGEILFVESITSQGKNGLTLTGNLGDVMKESATIAYEYFKAHAQDYGIKPDVFETTKVHVHVPEGATPKDGPSAGITMLTSLISSFTGRKVRSTVAMTGEITLRGKLLPVGGLKEKILAAKRVGIHDIVLSSENKKDVEDIKEDFLRGMTFHYFDSMKKALDYVLLQKS